MTDSTKLMVDRLRGLALTTCHEAAALIEQQAAALEAANARIAELEAAAKAEPVGEVVANDPVHGWHFQPYIGWQQLGAGRKLYTAPAATDNGGRRDAEKMVADLEAEQTFLGSSRETCSQYDWPRWDRLQAVIDYLKARGA